ncbi:MAG: hypothetical protein GY820_42360 [Gammaproteobacteria bacterium]|nr:hypothetical protein [Gammaproteobacteria bacterium]
MVVDYLGNGDEEELHSKVAYLPDRNCWQVKSTSRDDKMHLVEKIKENCTCTRTLIHSNLSCSVFGLALFCHKLGNVLFRTVIGQVQRNMIRTCLA